MSPSEVGAARRTLGLGAMMFRYPAIARRAIRIRRERITYLDLRSLMELGAVVRDIEKRGMEGSILEAGTALGGSAIMLATAKLPTRSLKVYDAFGMIPPPSESDGADVQERFAEIVSGKSPGIGGDPYYGYRDDLYEDVIRNFHRFGFDLERHRVQLIQGLFEETLKIDSPVAVAHLDCDWYESVMTCLRAIEPHLVPGGRFVIDDYYYYSGCRRAVDEFFADRRASYVFSHQSRLHVVKASARGT